MRNSIAIVFFTIPVLLFLFLKSNFCLNRVYSGSNFLPINPFTLELFSLPYAIRNDILTKSKVTLPQ